MEPIHLRTSGISVLLVDRGGELEIAHWGADLGNDLPDLTVLTPPVAHSAFDAPVTVGLIAQASSGWLGRPGLRGHRVRDGVSGYGFAPRLRVVEATVQGSASARVRHADRDTGIELDTVLRVHDGGLLEIGHELRNTADVEYVVDELAVVVPLPGIATEVLDLTGRWCREAHPQRHELKQGTWVRSGRHGRTGHDSALLVAAGTRGFGNRSGRVWGAHFAWSGDHEQFVEMTSDGRRLLGASELLRSGEVVLAPGGTYRTPSLFAGHSDRGLDGITAQFYRFLRDRPTHAGKLTDRARPVVLNTWEAVYFDQRAEAVLELVEAAADIGVERFVLDDGWFRGRRSDRAGLGDWIVDASVWPEGLTPIISAVRTRGMDFGLWVEPEMVSIDSDVAREHPDWIVRAGGGAPDGQERLPRDWRHQHVMDLVNPDAWNHVFEQLDALLTENEISYLKWDNNRDLAEFTHAGLPSGHAQTLAVYGLLDALRAAHPTVEIESCASGGARVDLGILQRTDRVWASDSNDALERQTIQRWTQLVVPPELTGSHVGPTLSHTTGRTHDIVFRSITALFGHFGIEWDIREAGDRERQVLRRAIALYKDYRALLHTGQRVNADLVDSSMALHGVVSAEGDEGLFALVGLTTSSNETPGRIGIPGLRGERRYRIETVSVESDVPPSGPDSPYQQVLPPPWLDAPPVVTGRYLDEVGLPMPILRPERAILLKVVQV